MHEAPFIPKTHEELARQPTVFAPDMLADQRVFVSGGGSGIGRATAWLAARLGARVVIGGRKEAKLAGVVDAINAHLGEARASYEVLDIRDREAVDGAFARIAEDPGPLDILVNSAGGQFPQAAIDYTELNHSYAELEAMPAAELPDGIFVVSSLPSQVATFLIEERGYRLQPIPLGPALALRDAAVHDGVIPAYAYSVDPAVPPSELHTPATYLLLVAHQSVSEEVVTRFLEAIFQGEFARRAQLQRLSPELLTQPPALPLHTGTREYLRRNDPLITAEAIDNLESLRSFFVSLAVALFLLWRWQRQRSQRGFEEYITEVSRLEAQALSIDSRYAIDLNAILGIRQRLSEIKIEAMDKFAAGELRGEELMASFLTHVSDLRHYLNDMILHERTRLEKAARRSDDDAEEVLERLWGRATRDRKGDSVSH